ncbi:MAG: hypothetical protein JXQ29_16615 [Planctomycetes bacterium]|nr:hypothetical protein [Planctomycetota bacterium]
MELPTARRPAQAHPGMSRRYHNEQYGRGGHGRPGHGIGQHHNRFERSWYVHWHPWYGYSWYFPSSWWYPFGACYYPSYYYRGHSLSFRFCIGLSRLWDWSFFGSWYYPSCYHGRYWYYPYYAGSLGYPYYRYVYVGSGPSNEYTTVYNYYFGAEEDAAAPEAEPAVVPPAEDAGASGADAAGLPEAPPPAPARVLSSSEYFLRLGDDAFLTGRYANAVEAYQLAVEGDPDSAVARFALAEALIATADYHQAAYRIREGLQRDRRWVDGDLDRRRLFGSADAFERVREQLDRQVADHPFDAAVHFVRGYARFFAGDRDAARASFAEAVRLRGEDEDAATFLEVLSAGESDATRDAAPPDRQQT